MSDTDVFQHNLEGGLTHGGEASEPPLQQQWPRLGRELFTLEEVFDVRPARDQPQMAEEEKRARRSALRRAIIAQLYQEEEGYSRDTRYLAFLLMKAGRGGAIVGNPSILEKNGARQELPYTGLEGYYAGSEQTPTRSGMTPQEIVQEEARIGAETLSRLKKRAIEQNSWVAYAHLKRALEQGEPDLEELRTCLILWSTIVRQLHVRVFHNAEFEPTLSESIEKMERLAGSLPGRTAEEKQARQSAYAECNRLKHELANLSLAEREQEKRERRRREKARSERLTEFQQFRDETYRMLTEPERERYLVGVQDTSLQEASILETITLPETPERNTYSPTPVQLTQEQREGYLFLARLGQIGGDPLTRSDLVAS